MNISHHVESASRLFPDKTALIFEGKSFTYKQLNQLGNCVANSLRNLGINKGDRLALFLPNIPEFIISYLGILKLGAIAVSINVMLKSPEVAYILNDCTAKVIITTEELCHQVKSDDLPFLDQILIAEGEANRGISLRTLIANASPNFPSCRIRKYYSSSYSLYFRNDRFSQGCNSFWASPTTPLGLYDRAIRPRLPRSDREFI